VFNSYRVVEREESVLLPRAALVPRLHGVIHIEVLGLLIELTLIYFCYFQGDAVYNAPGLVIKPSFLTETFD